MTRFIRHLPLAGRGRGITNVPVIETRCRWKRSIGNHDFTNRCSASSSQAWNGIVDRDHAVSESMPFFATLTFCRIVKIFASSPESVGEFWFWQLSKLMIQSDFDRFIGSKAISFFGSQFRLIVESLDDTCGNRSPRSEPVEN